MHPEWALLIVGLLWGPTAIWLLVRSFRGRSDERTADRPGGVMSVQPADLGVDRVLGDESWVCRRCRSFNRSGSSKCYSCGADVASGIPSRQVGIGVPVMAPSAIAQPERVAFERPALSEAPAVPSAVDQRSAPVTAANAVPAEVKPITDATPVSAPFPTAMTAVVVAAPPPVPLAPSPSSPPRARARRGAEAVPTPDRAAEPSGGPGGPVACPYLGMYDDPRTRFDFTHPANACHAAVAAGASGWRRFRLWRRRPTMVSAAHQTHWCLTARHAECPRYPKGGGAAAGT